MRIVPVLDLKEGQVVRGIAGRRREYRPIVSRLTPSCEPPAVALAFRELLGLDELYIADLDAIGGASPALAVFQALKELGFRLWIDAGIRQAQDAAALASAGVDVIVAGLESLAAPAVLADLCRDYGPERIVFSLDLKEGDPLNAVGWQAREPFDIAAQAIGLGVRRLLVLDLARVGVDEGPGTETLCRALGSRFADIELAAGGGVRDTADLERLHRAGVHIALVASALHDQRITRAEIDQLAG